ncbi:MAG: ribose transport system ATP-binding protein [Solirubrobacteraceae bacterium]|jgi:ABC-type sugar transport system ATPase subunit|nr:ribose transport system ATP-binding protein [Solirubrobacteraceae bacterium]
MPASRQTAVDARAGEANGRTDFGPRPGGRGGPLLSVESISKRYGETQALSGAQLAVAPGEVHALVGENGSGKSSLVKILSGVTSQDEGTLTLDGVPVTFRNPAEARRAGIVAVFQETLVASDLSVLDNVFMGHDGLFRKRHRRTAELAQARAALARIGLGNIDLDRPVWTLTLAQQQLVTIARALVQRWKLLLLDEATSALDIDGRERLFEVLADETRGGELSVLFVTHRMDEVMKSSHRITVLRAGQTVGVLRTADARLDYVLALMAGESGTAAAAVGDEGETPPLRVVPRAEAAPALELADIVLKPGATPFDLGLSQGAVLGVAALEGQGQADLLRCIAGIARPAAGTVLACRDGRSSDIHQSRVRSQHAREAFRQGIVYVPSDRKKEGIFPGLSVLDNLIVASLSRLSRFGVLRRRAAARQANDAVHDLGVKTAGVRAKIGTLSGGNQQKVVVGRWLLTEPRVLVLNDPMRGVDPGARRDLLNVLHQVADKGVAIILYSTELEELLTLCPEVAIVRDHSVTDVLSGERLTMDALIAGMFGQTDRMDGER